MYGVETTTQRVDAQLFRHCCGRASGFVCSVTGNMAQTVFLSVELANQSPHEPLRHVAFQVIGKFTVLWNPVDRVLGKNLTKSSGTDLRPRIFFFKKRKKKLRSGENTFKFKKYPEAVWSPQSSTEFYFEFELLLMKGNNSFNLTNVVTKTTTLRSVVVE